jgi:hypothetical protein
MALPHDLLAVARDLLGKELPTQATLRRSVSTDVPIGDGRNTETILRGHSNTRRCLKLLKGRGRNIRTPRRIQTRSISSGWRLISFNFSKNASLPTMTTAFNCRLIGPAWRYIKRRRRSEVGRSFGTSKSHKIIFFSADSRENSKAAGMGRSLNTEHPLPNSGQFAQSFFAFPSIFQ